ncbi:unnamed protein product [Lasius platythorax]|uniref:Uncharacterized protein n=1 Tax=Lasius platythorax TaxID=488582 RepID=A0AAV2NFQ5_9HYME
MSLTTYVKVIEIGKVGANIKVYRFDYDKENEGFDYDNENEGIDNDNENEGFDSDNENEGIDNEENEDLNRSIFLVTAYISL